MKKEEIAAIIRPIVEGRGAFLVDTLLKTEKGAMKVEVFIDTDAGVTTDLCAEISKDLSPVLDRVAGLQRRYYLIVSSPGVERSLKLPRQYPRNTGRTLIVSMRRGDRMEKTEGELVEVKSSGIVLSSPDKDIQEIAFDDILEAHVKLKW